MLNRKNGLSPFGGFCLGPGDGVLTSAFGIVLQDTERQPGLEAHVAHQASSSTSSSAASKAPKKPSAKTCSFRDTRLDRAP